MAPAAAAGPSHRRRFAALALALALALAPAAARPDKEMREKFYGTLVTNGTRNASGDGSIAEMFGRVLDKEFADSDTPDGTNLDLHRAFRSGGIRGFFFFRGEIAVRVELDGGNESPTNFLLQFLLLYSVLPPVLLGAMNSPTVCISYNITRRALCWGL
jgi:hypothetical protein